jgi:hypothetical protein
VKKPITSQGFIDAALKRFRFSRMHLAIFKDRPLGNLCTSASLRV